MSKTLYLECNMGAAGDMITAALYELLDEKEKKEFCQVMNKEELGICVVPEKVEKCGVQGTHIKVLIGGQEEESCEKHIKEHSHHKHLHASLAEVHSVIDSYPVKESVKNRAKTVYKQIAEAESHAHGKSVSEIHFHEVGMKDAIADVLNTCWIADKLSVDKIIVSDINVGFGEVHCAHGILPVPAPATAFLLQGAPTYQGEIRGEMCTPTGAALLQHLKTNFGKMPVMKVEKIGYGMGKKDFPQANCIRAFLGEESEKLSDKIVELSCNLDDMTGEEIAFAAETLRMAGALDVYTETIVMKKNRPGVKLVCICNSIDTDRMVQMILKNTTTWGIRRLEYDRYILERHVETIETEYGCVTIKKGTGYGITKWKPEYEDMAAIAESKKISIKEVEQAVIRALL
ncbi:MAG: nickel pincer cofactor biosynthesis protein LarC [Lachnospiraceae bacterium]|nr:nickel pincer cofactor biosynthesis protein LarC [Lachnospiraceae bacterium]